MRTAIVGCGKIADQHVHAIRRIRDCDIVAVCDREPLMARQLAERMGIRESFGDLQEMLRTAHPQIVHITTPPQTHFSVARQCVDAGSHVYLEKPFTVTADEARALIEIAEGRGVKVTAGHNYQFTLEMLDMRRLVNQGFLGGPPVHMESHWCYDLGDASYVGPVLGNRAHWVPQLPGQLLHNVVSHGIARLSEFLDDDLIYIAATAYQSLSLQTLGGGDILDELRVVIRDKRGTTAFFCFSTQIRPGLNQFRICGPSNSIFVDQTSGSLIRCGNQAYKSYLTYVGPPLKHAAEHLHNARLNVTRFLRRQLHQDFGMKELIGRFYQSIRTGGPLPIPYREIVLTSRIMDAIFEQVYPVKNQIAVTGSRK